MSNPESATFFCVANRRIIRERQLPTNGGYASTFEMHDGNQYPTIEAAMVVAQDLARRYSSEFFVLQAVKSVCRERPPIEVVDLVAEKK